MFASTSSRRTALALTLAAACWGLGTVVSKRAIDEIPPLTLLPIQLGASLAALAFLMRWRNLPFRDPAAAPILGRLGLLNPGLAYALSLLGLAYVTVSLSVILWALEPLLILFLAAWFLREPIGPAIVALSTCALGGVLLVIYQPGSEGSLIGVLLTIAGVACCATYTVVTRRWLASADSTPQVVVAQQLHALAFAFVLVAAVWLLGGAVRPERVSAAGWPARSDPASSATASPTGSACRRCAPSQHLWAAVSFYLIPLFGVAGAFVFLGERLEPSQWLGAALVLAAILVILRRTTQLGIAPSEQPLRA